ncbi:hypothetical protein ACFV7Q_36535 [Streptomyces sp. NPDC059851]|uniref:hypothetical protein n=1 Tax=Streptomyces sp. NPDC059851 TaxID=3346971 RepID=UPI0036655009
MYDPKEQEQERAQDHTDDSEQGQHRSEPGTEPDHLSKPGWRKRAQRAALFTLKETLRGISSGLGSVVVTAAILWWQSRH